MSLVKLTSVDGASVTFDDALMAGSGGMKDVYFAPDRSYVVAWFRKAQDANSIDRLKNIVGVYRDRIFNQPGGDYWDNLFRWPTHLVQDKGRTGLVVPTYQKHFFFEYGSKNNDTLLAIRGREKEGKWFASANHQQKHLDPRERGDWLHYFGICIRIARATRRLHAAGLAHSDLSYRNVLVDPRSGNACIIDIDGLVVPNKFPPDVIGTPDFIAPEVMATIKLPLTDKARHLPRRETDQHALAVLIYMYLLYRHPLRGGKNHASDPQRDEELMMGEKALFIEHPANKSNRPNLKDVKSSYLPYADVTSLPYGITGPYLKDLFDQAFITGLHSPSLRPSADEWERALVKTVDLLQPCQNTNCVHKWFVFDNTTRPICPFCKTSYKGSLPILNLYSSDGKGTFRPDNYRVMVYSDQYLYPWHVSRWIAPNERATAEQRKPVGYFVFHLGKWILVNQKMPGLKDVTGKKSIAIGERVELCDGQKLLLSPEEGGRLVHVQMVTA